MVDSINEESEVKEESMTKVESSAPKELVKDEAKEEGFVPRTSFQEVSADMHKFKQESRQLKAELEALRLQREAEENQKLIDEKRWEEVAKKETEKRELLERKAAEDKENFLKATKVSKVISACGGLKRSAYTRFIDTNNIKVDEYGSIDEASVQAEVNRLKAEFPELLSGSAPAPAPSSAPQPTPPNPARPLSQMSKEEKRRALIAQLKTR